MARDENCVVLGAEPDRDHLGNPDAGLCCHQRRDRLVFDLLESPDGRAAWWIAVGEELPATRQPLGVLRVSTEHADLDRSSVRGVAEELGGADPLLCRDSQAVDVDSEGSDGSAHRSVGGTPAAEPRATRTSAPDARPSAIAPEHL